MNFTKIVYETNEVYEYPSQTSQKFFIKVFMLQLILLTLHLQKTVWFSPVKIVYNIQFISNQNQILSNHIFKYSYL